MEFKEVENINKEVIVKVKDKIHLKELMGYMEKWDFSTMTIQSIKAEINNHGEAYAVIQFLDSVKRRPVTFPKMMAALKDTKQYDVYGIFRKQIGKYFNRNKERLQEVLSMISKEEEDLGITEVHDDTTGRDNVSSSGGQSRNNGQARGDSTLSSDIQAQTQVVYNLGVSSPLDNNPPGATGKTNHDSENPFQPRQLDPNFAGASISDLKANVYKMLGQALERTHGDDREQWWDYIISNGDINVSRKEQRNIRKQRSPGVEFLDILDERGYTLADLHDLFTQFRINEALNILQQHQDKVIDDRNSNENNLNVNQRSKADANKDMNISAASTESSEGQNDKSQTVQVLPKQSSSQVENKESSSSKFNRNSGPINISRPDSSSSDLLSIESNTDISSIIEDDSIKGTIAVQAHGDQSNTQSQLNPDDDAMKLRNDRVHQFDLDPGAIENTSFIPVRRTNGTQNNSQTNEAEQSNSNIQSDQEGRMRNNEQSDETGEDVNNPVEPNESSGSQGNLPLLSGFSMVVDNVREGQVQGQNVEPGGVVNIPPRSLDSHEKDFTERTGVNLVPPSIESQSLRETTEDSRQSGDENNQTTGSIGEPDLIQGTHCGTGPCENVSADENPEN